MIARFACVLLSGLLCAAALAQPAAAPAKAASAPVDDTLYRDLGGQPGLVALVDDFVPRLVADPKIGHFFAKTDLPSFKARLVEQFCLVSGGGCRYQGANMKVAHEEHDIRMSDFNLLVEDLQVSMDARGIPFSTQNRLLARLAPMHKDIVNTH